MQKHFNFKNLVIKFVSNLLREPRSNKRHLERVGIRVESVKGFRRHRTKHSENASRELVANCGQIMKYLSNEKKMYAVCMLVYFHNVWRIVLSLCIIFSVLIFSHVVYVAVSIVLSQVCWKKFLNEISQKTEKGTEAISVPFSVFSCFCVHKW